MNDAELLFNHLLNVLSDHDLQGVVFLFYWFLKNSLISVLYNAEHNHKNLFLHDFLSCCLRSYS